MLIAIGKVAIAVTAAGLLSYFVSAFLSKAIQREIKKRDRMVLVIPFSSKTEDLEYVARNARKLSGGSCETVLINCGADEERTTLSEKLSQSLPGLSAVKETEFIDYIQKKL